MSRWFPVPGPAFRGCGLAAGLQGGAGSASERGFVGIKSRFPRSPAPGLEPSKAEAALCREQRCPQMPHPGRTFCPIPKDTPCGVPGPRAGTSSSITPAPGVTPRAPAPTWAPRGAAGSSGAGQAPAPGLPLPSRAVKPAGWEGRVRTRPRARAGLGWAFPGWAHPGRHAPHRLSLAAVPAATRTLFPARHWVWAAQGASPSEKVPARQARHVPAGSCGEGKGGERRAGPAASLRPQVGSAYPGGLLSGRAPPCPLPRGGSAQHLRDDQSAQGRLCGSPALWPRCHPDTGDAIAAAQPANSLLQWGEGGEHTGCTTMDANPSSCPIRWWGGV